MLGALQPVGGLMDDLGSGAVAAGAREAMDERHMALIDRDGDGEPRGRTSARLAGDGGTRGAARREGMAQTYERGLTLKMVGSPVGVESDSGCD